jgi:ubiquinone biosynthesis protein
MLTMERLPGISINDLNGSQEFDCKKLAKRGAKLYLKMIFEDGVYHADPHPGNILIAPDGTIGLLDFGMIGRISPRMRDDIESMLLSMVNQDVPLMVMLIRRIGRIPANLDESALSADVADFVTRYSNQSLSQFDMTGALTDFISIVRRYDIRLPGEVALLLKVLITLEGTGRLLSPDFSLMDVMRPMHRTMMLRRFSPSRQIRKIRRFYLQFEELAESLPVRVSHILEQIQTGKFDVHLDHRRLGPTVNRLVMGLMTSALFLGSSLMLSYEVPPLLFSEPADGVKNMSVLGLVGCSLSLMMGLRLAWAIRISGNLNSKEKEG